jgi:imidazolonepropionase-like amidohydrolase
MCGMVLCGKVIDGSLSPPVEHGAVAVEGERIAWVGPAHQLPERFRKEPFERREKPGWSIMPGLIDGHTHISFGEARSEEELALYTPVEFRALRAMWNARKVLQAGVTSAFDAATVNEVAQCVRDAIDADMYEGPRFAVSGRQLTSHQGLEDSFPNNMEFPPGQAGVLIKSKDDLIEAIRAQVKDRVDAIKVSGSNDNLITPDALDGAAFTLEEFEVIARETHRLGKICTVHARSRDAVIAAATAGFDIIFHASYIDDEGIEACLKSGSIITPTLTFLINSLDATNDEYGVSGMDAVRREVDAAATGLAKAHRAGIPMICGSESGWSAVPYGDWHAREMQVFVEFFGMSPLEAIHCATLGATRCLKRFGDHVGKLEAGRFADILVVNGDPTQDVRLLMDKRKFEYVFKGGVPVDLTPPAPRKRWYFEKHKIFLNGWFRYDPDQRKGFVQS